MSYEPQPGISKTRIIKRRMEPEHPQSIWRELNEGYATSNPIRFLSQKTPDVNVDPNDRTITLV
uniref:Uncharacterized protein n=1 Tax=Arion vulgaris TaxID=1028688 RepID=A0A0B6YX80_9EUPU